MTAAVGISRCSPRISRSLSSGAHSRDPLAHAGYLLRAACFRFGGASLGGSLGANAALPVASPPPELWAASSTAKAAEILIAKFRCSKRGRLSDARTKPAGPFGGLDRIRACPTGKSLPPSEAPPKRVQPLSQKYSAFAAGQINSRTPAVSRPLRGAYRDRHERRCGMRWTRAAPKARARPCGRRSRVVLTPRRWRQVCERQLSQATVANKPGHRGERDISVKTIA
jgi:hypothetical protein